jgi:rod shape-determining protein MreD
VIRYVLYIALLYILLPLNASIDLISMMIFFIALTENESAALLVAFFAGLLIDLYYPVLFGINMLTYAVLVQAVVYFRKYFTQSPFVIFAVFTCFYIIRSAVMYIIVTPTFHIPLFVLTIVFFLPVFVILNRTLHGTWMRT